MEHFIKVTYKSTRNSYIAKKYLEEIQQYSLFAADFETSVKYREEDKAKMREELRKDHLSKSRRIELEAALNATALSHPFHVTLTHCSIAINDHEAYVFILDNDQIRNLILRFLVTTTIKQIWHNASFDFKHIMYHTNQIPLNFEDTQIFAKTILNHVETHKANTGLKELAGHKYGAWGISKDNFDIEHMYDEKVLHYAAIDACATYWLWGSINRYVEEVNDTEN